MAERCLFISRCKPDSKQEINSRQLIPLKNLRAKKTPEKLRSTIAAVARSRNRKVDSLVGKNPDFIKSGVFQQNRQLTDSD